MTDIYDLTDKATNECVRLRDIAAGWQEDCKREADSAAYWRSEAERLRSQLDEAQRDSRRLDSGEMKFRLMEGGAWLTWRGDLRAAIDAAVKD